MAYLASMTATGILPVCSNTVTAFSTSWDAWLWGWMHRDTETNSLVLAEPREGADSSLPQQVRPMRSLGQLSSSGKPPPPLLPLGDHKGFQLKSSGG